MVNSAVFKSLYVSSAYAFFGSVPFSWPWYSGFAKPGRYLINSPGAFFSPKEFLRC